MEPHIINQKLAGHSQNEKTISNLKPEAVWKNLISAYSKKKTLETIICHIGWTANPKFFLDFPALAETWEKAGESDPPPLMGQPVTGGTNNVAKAESEILFHISCFQEQFGFAEYPGRGDVPYQDTPCTLSKTHHVVDPPLQCQRHFSRTQPEVSFIKLQWHTICH